LLKEITEDWQKNYALRKEKGVFAYFCRRLDKSKASGGTRPAGLAFKNFNKKKKGNRFTICYSKLQKNSTCQMKKQTRHQVRGLSEV